MCAANRKDEVLISIIVPIYNGEKYLAETLASVRAQTYPKFECLCYIDGGTDGSPEIVQAFTRADSRFKMVVQRNRGVAWTRNRGLDEAHGTFVVFLDADDLLANHALESLLNVQRRTNADCVQSGFCIFSHGNPSTESRSAGNADDFGLSYTPFDGFFGCATKHTFNISVWGKLYRRVALDGIRFPEDVYGADDFVFSARLAMRLQSYAFLKGPILYHYRMHPENLTSQMPMKYILGWMRSREIVWQELENRFKGTARLDWIRRRFTAESFSWSVKKTCRRTYSEMEMRKCRSAFVRLISNGTIVPQGWRERLKANLFIHERTRLLRLFFPSLFKAAK